LPPVIAERIAIRSLHQSESQVGARCRTRTQGWQASIVEEEAEQVQTIFRRYLALSSVNRLVLELRERNFRTKIRKLSKGETRGGVHFTQGPLFYMLRNRFYIGEVLYKGEICPGPQPPLIERGLFDAVQARLTKQRSHYVTTRTKSDAPLRGILFDNAGNPMVRTHATKQGVRYRYYVSRPYLRGIIRPPVGAIVRAATTSKQSSPGCRAAPAQVSMIPAKRLSGAASISQTSPVEVRKDQLAIC
jgi:hypothetical protein